MKKMFTYLLIATLLTTNISTSIINTTYALEIRTQSPTEWFNIVDGVLYGFDEAYFQENDTPIPTHITIPDGVTDISQQAFEMTDLVSVSFPDSLTNIGNYAFKLCSSLTTVNFGSGLKTLGKGAFSTTSIQSINFPGSLAKIGDEAFMDCEKLSNVSFSTGNKTIGKMAFLNNKSLTKIDLPSTITEIQAQAFQGCSNLHIVNFSEVLTAIQTNSFKDCDLYSITIPSTTTKVATGAFLGNNNLNEVKNNAINQVFYPGSLPTHSGSKIAYGYDDNQYFKDAAIAANYEFISLGGISKPIIKGVDLFTIDGLNYSMIIEVENRDIIAEYSFDNGLTWQTSNSKDATVSAMIPIRVKDIRGTISETYYFDCILADTTPIIKDVTGVKQDDKNVLITVKTNNDFTISEYSYDNGLTWTTSKSKIVPIGSTTLIKAKNKINQISETYSFKFEDDSINKPEPIVIKNTDVVYDVEIVKAGTKPIGPILSIYKDLLDERPETSNSNASKRANEFLNTFGETCVASFKK